MRRHVDPPGDRDAPPPGENAVIGKVAAPRTGQLA